MDRQIYFPSSDWWLPPLPPVLPGTQRDRERKRERKRGVERDRGEGNEGTG